MTASAPGKLMLLGEHAVMYGYPCLVTAVDKRLSVSLSAISNQKSVTIDANDLGINGYEKSFKELGKGKIPKGAKFVEFAVKNFFDYARHSERSEESLTNDDRKKILRFTQNDDHGLQITTHSEFSSQYGFGSSAASTVATIQALAALFDISLSKRELFDFSYKTVHDIQHTGSGFDVASAVYGGTLYYVGGGKTIEPLDISPIPLIVGYSGVKADTASLVKEVKALRENDPEQIDSIFSLIKKIVEKGNQALLREDLEALGILLNQNQEYLFSLGVSTDKINDILYAAVSAGAYGAKLSGAGGGDSIIALSPKENRDKVNAAIEHAGGQIIDVKTHAEGVRVENSKYEARNTK